MARGRMLNQKISEDLEFNEMSMEHQFFFMRTLPFLDRDGLITGHPLLLPSKVLPLMPDQHDKFKEAIKVWIDAGFVTEYLDGKQPVLFFVHFADNQANMRYDRESPSEFAPPPGYKRTPKGLRPEGEPDELYHVDTQPNGEDPDDPDNVRQGAGHDPRIRSREDQVKDQREDQHAREATPSPSVASPSPLDSAQAEYLPGLPDPRQRKNAQRGEIAERFAEAKRLGLTPEQFRSLVDVLLLGFGKKAMVDAGNDRALYFAQDLTLKVMRMSENFRTADGLQEIFRSWYRDDWRGKKGEKPTSEQFEEHASAMADGTIGKPQYAEAKPTLTAKQWCLNEYGTDMPTVALGIPESQWRSKYEQAIRVH